MKRLTAIILTAVIFFALAVSVSAHDAVTTAAYGAPDAIDGIRDKAWDKAEKIFVGDLSGADVGDEISTADVWTLWDGKYLYIFAEIKDKTVDADVEKKDPGAFWDQDALGIMINYDYSTVNTGKDTSYRGLGEKNFAGYTNVPAVKGDVHSREKDTIMELDRYHNEIKTYCVITDKGWNVEARMPLAVYKEFKPGDKIGFELCLNNSIGKGSRASQTVWKQKDGAKGADSWTNPSNFGTLILGMPPVETTAAAAAAGTAAPAQAAQTADITLAAAAICGILSLAGAAIRRRG